MLRAIEARRQETIRPGGWPVGVARTVLPALRRLTCLFALLALAGCAAPRGQYSYKVSLVSPDPSPSATFEDQDVRIAFRLHDSHFAITLTNKSEQDLLITWDEVAVIYPTGEAKRVIHAGIRLCDKDSPQTPSTVPPGSALADVLCPKDLIRYSAGPYGTGWRYGHLLPDKRPGAAFKIRLPLRFGQSTREYTFELLVDEVVLEPEPQRDAKTQKAAGKPPAGAGKAQRR